MPHPRSERQRRCVYLRERLVMIPSTTCKMSFRKICKWLKTLQSESQTWPVSPMSQCGLNNESYRKALQQFRNRRRSSAGFGTNDEFRASETIRENDRYFSTKDDNEKEHNEGQLRRCESLTWRISGVPYVQASEIFEIKCVAGTEDRYLEMISAEWYNTRVSLRRHTHPACYGAIKADIEVLTEIRHTNVLLLMATTCTDDHGLVSIVESVDCTLYSYIHDQRKRLNIIEIARIGLKLADALKYCHMRGYIHSAISSHCVYFTSTDVKLGGWEMAITKNSNIQREYEERLRMEIFNWQAPEFFQGLPLSMKSDVYGLSLLVWEMSTTCVPWHGYNRPHVERQYLTRKRGVIMDLYNFPPCLQRLLENGLQVDVTKRTLDMDKIQKTLQRLLMFKEEEFLCTNERESNNNDSIIHVSSEPPSENMASMKKSIAEQTYCRKIEKESSNQFLRFEKVQYDSDLENSVRKENAFLDNSTATLVTETPIAAHSDCAKKTHICKEHKTNEKLHSSARRNIKRMKEIIANRRKHFFQGNNSTNSSYQISSSTDTSSRLSSKQQIASNNSAYVLCKPASHTTNMDLKYKKSPGEYEGTTTKSSRVQQHKTPYMNVPASVRNAIVQPKILHSDPQSFYESTLWWKEKLICLSRMARTSEEQISSSPQRSFTDIRSNNSDKTQCAKIDSTNDKIQCFKSDLTNDKTQCFMLNSMYDHVMKPQCSKLNFTNNNDTFTIAKNTSEDAENNYIENVKNLLSKEIESDQTLKVSNPSYDEVLQKLRDALDRAFEIVRSTIPQKCLLYPKAYNSEFGEDNIQKYKSIFNELYGMKSDNSNQQIKPNENSANNKSCFGIDKDINMESGIETTVECEKKFNEESFIRYDNTIHDSLYSNEFISEVITELLNENYASAQNYQLKNLQESDQDRRIDANRIMSTLTKTEAIKENFKLNKNEFKDTDIAFLPFKSNARCENCNSHIPNSLVRRYSLPTKLNQLKITYSPSSEKIDASRKHLRDSKITIEDSYIDDDFREPLNDNLVLLYDSPQNNYLYDQKLYQTTEL